MNENIDRTLSHPLRCYKCYSDSKDTKMEEGFVVFADMMDDSVEEPYKKRKDKELWDFSVKFFVGQKNFHG